MIAKSFTITILAIVLLACESGARAASRGKPIAPGGPDLKTTLEKGLKARRPGEFAFIERVVTLVNQGVIPSKVVETDFLWARQRQPYPMPYFMRSMQIRAKRFGAKLD